MNRPDPRALCAAEKYAKGPKQRLNDGVRKNEERAFLAGWAARHAAGPPEGTIDAEWILHKGRLLGRVEALRDAFKFRLGAGRREEQKTWEVLLKEAEKALEELNKGMNPPLPSVVSAIAPESPETSEVCENGHIKDKGYPCPECAKMPESPADDFGNVCGSCGKGSMSLPQLEAHKCPAPPASPPPGGWQMKVWVCMDDLEGADPESPEVACSIGIPQHGGKWEAFVPEALLAEAKQQGRLERAAIGG